MSGGNRDGPSAFVFKLYFDVELEMRFDMRKTEGKVDIKTVIISAVIIVAAVFLSVSIFFVKYYPLLTEKKYELSEDMGLSFSNADDLVESLRGSLIRHSISMTVTCHANGNHMSSIKELVDELMEAALYDSADAKGGDYIRYQYGGYVFSYSHFEKDEGYDYCIKIEPTYYTDLEQEMKVDEDVEKILKEMKFNIFTTDYEKVKKIYDYVYENVDYDIIHKKTEAFHLKSTAYAALENHNAVCQGYAVTMYRLLKEAGVDCRVVTGMAEYDGKSEFHAWNIVRLKGRYYNLDVTWDKLLDTHDYFLRSDEFFEKTHTRDDEFSTDDFKEKYVMSDSDF